MMLGNDRNARAVINQTEELSDVRQAPVAVLAAILQAVLAGLELSRFFDRFFPHHLSEILGILEPGQSSQFIGNSTVGIVVKPRYGPANTGTVLSILSCAMARNHFASRVVAQRLTGPWYSTGPAIRPAVIPSQLRQSLNQGNDLVLKIFEMVGVPLPGELPDSLPVFIDQVIHGVAARCTRVRSSLVIGE